MKNDNLKNQYRVNEQIRVNEVRIVGDDIESMVLPTSKALRMAEEAGAEAMNKMTGGLGLPGGLPF